MFSFSRLRYLYLAYFSKPASDRILYRAIRRLSVRRILEIGIDSPQRSVRMVNLARRGAGSDAVRYAAVDLFEARPVALPQGLSLKDTHKLLAATHAQVQLIPGDPAQALARAANALGKIDLLLISAQHDATSLGAAWFYMPRMLHPKSRVYLESRPAGSELASYRLVPHGEIETLAEGSRRRRAA